MRNFMELIEMGVPIGIGIYIGYETIETIVEIVSHLICSIIKKLMGR